ncbi:MAG: hypothetical protein FJX60_00670 [Alphaproteobacteria bacterium]|nr:hypothetical protein [Alphaproteobacteria bacterium]
MAPFFAGCPMLFNLMLNNFDRSDWGWLSDTVNFLVLGIEAAGHRCQIGGNVAVLNGINLFLQSIPQTLIASLKADRLPFAFICTELIDENNQLGWGMEAEDSGHSETVAASCRESLFVWSLLPGSLPFCLRHNPNSHYCPFGYLEAMRWPLSLPETERRIDFLISGILTERRLEIGKRLTDKGYSVAHTGHPTPDYVRNDLLARSRFHLAVKKSANHELISPTRLCHSLINGVPLIAEYDGPGDDPYLEFCLPRSANGFAEACAEIHGRMSPADTGARMARRLRERFDFPTILSRLIPASLGALR